MSSVFTSRLRGRGTEWQATLGLLDAAAAGRHAVLLVEGARDTGKTGLLTAAEDAAQQRGFSCTRITAIECYELESAAVRIAERASRVPTLVTLDDLESAQVPAIVALRVLPGRLATLPVGWMTARRQGAGGSATQQLLDEWTVLGAHRIDLGPLSAPAVAEVVADAFDGRPDDAFLSLVRGTGGNPGLLAALLDGLRQDGSVAVGDGEVRLLSALVPQGVEETIDTWLEEVSPSALTLLEVAAFLGASFTRAELAVLLGCRPEGLGPAVDEIVGSGLLIVGSDATMAFQHDLVRQSVTRRVPEAVSATLRRQAADASSRPVDPPPSKPSRREKAAGRGPHRLDDRWQQLTEGERTVADLVGQGLSNRQTAERIFLSPHTVSFHLRKVYRKFGITSRVELARLATERERAAPAASGT
jgi:DNA-binding CsgD family transcriptional regulator